MEGYRDNILSIDLPSLGDSVTVGFVSCILGLTSSTFFSSTTGGTTFSFLSRAGEDVDEVDDEEEAEEEVEVDVEVDVEVETDVGVEVDVSAVVTLGVLVDLSVVILAAVDVETELTDGLLSLLLLLLLGVLIITGRVSLPKT